MFVLIHSPLVGPFTWSLLAEKLRTRNLDVLVPAIHTISGSTPYWQQHSSAVAQAIAQIPQVHKLVLVGHSGAGLLLPAIRQRLDRPVAGYLFVDAGIPIDGHSRLDLLRLELPSAAEAAAQEGLQPSWTDDDLREEVPDATLRARLLAELQPQPLGYRTEPIPVFGGWPDAPCGYLQLTPGYDYPAGRAQAWGWSYGTVPGGHFQMLVDPAGIADALVNLCARMGIVDR